MGRDTWRVLAATHLLAAGAAFALATSPDVAGLVQANAGSETSEDRAFAIAVETLRAEASLRVFSFTGFAAVSVERDGFLILDAREDLLVPAEVGYYLDVSRLTDERLAFDKHSRTLTVQLTPLKIGQVAFRPEEARSSHHGVLSFSQREVDKLRARAFKAARAAFARAARNPTLLAMAEGQAKREVERYLTVALRSAGMGDVRVIATFAG